MKWVLLTTAPNQLTAETWKNLLEAAGIDARIRPGDAYTFLGVSGLPCGLMVPAEQQERAKAILNEELNPES
jgi:hypothetical protein